MSEISKPRSITRQKLQKTLITKNWRYRKYRDVMEPKITAVWIILLV
ncbi:MAG: hypothetical protein AABW93_01630 [Nanoarchaeota archaeon]